MPGSSGNLNTQTKAPEGTVSQDAYAPSDPHDFFDQGITKKKSKFANKKLIFDSISSCQGSQFPDVKSDLDATPTKQDIKVALGLTECRGPTKTLPKIFKGHSSSEKKIDSGSSKKESAFKLRRSSSKSIAFLYQDSNFEKMDLLDSKFESKIYRRPSTAEFQG
jgi:hypothetical protein